MIFINYLFRNKRKKGHAVRGEENSSYKKLAQLSEPADDRSYKELDHHGSANNHRTSKKRFCGEKYTELRIELIKGERKFKFYILKKLECSFLYRLKNNSKKFALVGKLPTLKKCECKS